MGDVKRVPVPFGEGIDREAGILVTRPSAMEDLRNVYLRRGKFTVRKGSKPSLSFTDPDGASLTHILAGQSIRGLRIGLVVGYNQNTGRVYIYRTDASATVQDLVPFSSSQDHWFEVVDPGNSPIPVVHTAHSNGLAFFAHDRFSQVNREPTVYYDPFSGAELNTLTADFLQREDSEAAPVRFRGVESHLDYLFGWGYGTQEEARPELLRVSRPAAPTLFDPAHYFIIGSEQDPIVTARPSGDVLVVFKEHEIHRVFGSGQHNFGSTKVDSRFGCAGTRLAVSVKDTVFFWAIDGPRATSGGASQLISTQLELKGFEPDDLPSLGTLERGFAEYAHEEQIALWVFGNRRVYALNLRGRQRGWSYWELGFDAQTAFTFYDADTGSRSGDAPSGNSDFIDKASTRESTTSFSATFNNEGIDGDEFVELWRRPVANHAWEAPIMHDLSATGGVVDGWSSGGAATASYALEDHDGDGQDDAQEIEVTGGAAGEQAYIERVFDSVSAGNTYRFSVHHEAAGLTDLEGRLEIAFRDDTQTVLQTEEITGLTEETDGGLRRYMEHAAPTDTVDVRVRLIAHVTGSSPSGSIAFRSLLIHDPDADDGWERADTVQVAVTQTTPQTVLIDGNEPGWFYEVAIRHRRAVQYPTAYQSSDPYDWPDEAKALAKNESSAPTLDEVKWQRTGGSEIKAFPNYTPHLAAEHRVTVDGTVDSTQTVSSSQVGQQQGFTVSSDDGNISPETNEKFVVEAVHPDGLQIIPSDPIFRWMGPEDPLIENIIAHPEEATVHWTIQGGDDSYGTPADGDVRTEIYNSIDDAYDITTTEGATNGLTQYATQSEGTTITFKIKHFVENYGVRDYSPEVSQDEDVASDSGA